MQEDPELCLAAVNQNGYALQQPGWSFLVAMDSMDPGLRDRSYPQLLYLSNTGHFSEVNGVFFQILVTGTTRSFKHV